MCVLGLTIVMITHISSSTERQLPIDLQGSVPIVAVQQLTFDLALPYCMHPHHTHIALT